MTRVINTFIVGLLLPVAASCQYACSGLDRVDVYINSKLVTTATFANVPVIKLDKTVKSDTIAFHAYTNWDGLRNSTVDVKNASGELISHINSTGTGYDAVYTYVFDRANMEDTDSSILQVFLNMLCEREVEVSQVATIRLLSR